MRNFIIAAMAVAFMAGAAPAQAQFYYEDSSPSWRFWDAPRNTSYVDCNIVNDMPSFGRVDRNNDGYLSGWEFRRVGFGGRAFNQLDLNNNGYVSRSEIRAAQRSCY